MHQRHPWHPQGSAMTYLITTPVAGGICPRCHQLTLTGIAEGLSARVDLAPINPAGEIAELLAGRWTYTLSRTGLVHRDAHRIAAGTLRGPTLTTHRCRQQRPAEHLAVTPDIPAAPVDPDRPPF